MISSMFKIFYKKLQKWVVFYASKLTSKIKTPIKNGFIKKFFPNAGNFYSKLLKNNLNSTNRKFRQKKLDISKASYKLKINLQSSGSLWIYWSQYWALTSTKSKALFHINSQKISPWSKANNMWLLLNTLTTGNTSSRANSSFQTFLTVWLIKTSSKETCFCCSKWFKAF